jgi:hypothetical protein
LLTAFGSIAFELEGNDLMRDSGIYADTGCNVESAQAGHVWEEDGLAETIVFSSYRFYPIRLQRNAIRLDPQEWFAFSSKGAAMESVSLQTPKSISRIRWLKGVILRLSNSDHFQFGAVQRTAMLDETLHNSPLALRHRDNGLEEIAHA